MEGSTVVNVHKKIAEELCNYDIPGIEVLEGYRSGSVIVSHGDYAYVINYRRNNAIYMKCRIRECNATSSIMLKESGPSDVQDRNEHLHPPDTEYISTIKFRSELRKESRKRPTRGCREVFNQVSSRHKKQAEGLTFNSVASLMLRSRKRLELPNISNLDELEEVLENAEWAELGKSYHAFEPEAWYRGVHTAQDGTKVAAFISESMIQSLHAIFPQILFLDGSFDLPVEVLPDHQLFVCSVAVDDKIFAFALFIMSYRTVTAYKKCLELLQLQCKEPVNPVRVIYDYDPALLKAIQAMWSPVEHQGCYFNFVESVVRKCYKKGSYLVTKPRNRKLIKYFLCLPLLPPERILAGFETVIDIVHDERLSKSFDRFINYFKLDWIETVGPENLSVYEMPDSMNICVEIFQRKLKGVAAARKDIWSFLDGLRLLEYREIKEFWGYLDGKKQIKKKQFFHLKDDRIIAQALKSLMSGFITSDRECGYERAVSFKAVMICFLDEVSIVIEGLIDRITKKPPVLSLRRPRKLPSSNGIYHDIEDISFVMEEDDSSTEPNTPQLKDHDYSHAENIKEEQEECIVEELKPAVNLHFH